MKVRMRIKQIRCSRETHPWGSNDEIYLAYFTTLGRVNTEIEVGEIKKCVAKRVSDVKNGVKKGKKWQPINMTSEWDLTGAEQMKVVLALYERDDGAIYRRLKEIALEPIQPADFDWNVIGLPGDFKSPFEWITVVWKAMAGIYNYVKQDDLMGTRDISIDLVNDSTENWAGLREYKFKRHGGDYRVTLELEIV